MQLSAKEQKQLQRENGGGGFDLNKLGKPGHHFDTTQFMTMNLSFPERESRKVAAIDGVQATAGALALPRSESPASSRCRPSISAPARSGP